MLRVALILSAVLVSACSASSGGGGSGALTYISGTACGASITAPQCGLNAGKAAVLKCTGGVWLVTNDCASGETCTVKAGVAACASSSATGDTVSGDDGFAFDATTQPTDVKTGNDAQNVDDVPVLEDTVMTPDIAKDVGKDVGKDIAKDVPKDIGPPVASWGQCSLNDNACMQGCVQSSCTDPYSNCQNDSGCNQLLACNSGCGATPIKMPTQSGSPIPQNSGETQKDYCYRVCSAQAGPSAVALDYAYIECVIGMCVDCSQSASAGITKAQCQSSCGLENYCQTEYSACLNDTDCLAFYGCLLNAADQAGQQDCAAAAASNAQSIFTSFNDCVTANATKCVAP